MRAGQQDVTMRLGLKILVAILSFMSLPGCSRSDREFQELKWSHEDTHATRTRAELLKEDIRGVQLALQDFDCFGGATGSYSSWILRNSSLNEYVNAELEKIAKDSGSVKAKRLEAYAILWSRTKDKSWLISLFQEVRAKGGIEVWKARVNLGRALSEIDGAFTLFDVREDKDLSISTSEFKALIERLKSGKPGLPGERLVK